MLQDARAWVTVKEGERWRGEDQRKGLRQRYEKTNAKVFFQGRLDCTNECKRMAGWIA